jgi:hypothetical protein
MAFPLRISIFLCAASLPCLTPAQPLSVRSPQEPMHRTFIMKAPDGRIIAGAEETAAVAADQVRSRMTFRFRDGSLDDEEAVFTQDKDFHLLRDHHVQKGPSFPTPIDITVDVSTDTVTWHQQKSGRDQVRTGHLGLPGNLANGIMPLLVENFPPHAQALQTSWVAVPTHPMVVDISIKPAGERDIDPGGRTERVREFVLHPELHGFVGFLAPLVNKMPADIHVWVTDAARPCFVKLTGPFFPGGPDWTVEPTVRQRPE